MRSVRDMRRQGVGRDDDQRHTISIYVSATPLRAVGQDLRRRNMIVPASPVVPGDDDRGVGPVGTVADGIHNRSYPGRSGTVGGVRVIGGCAIGDDPAHGRQLAAGYVGEDLRLRDNYIVPRGPRTDELAVLRLRLAHVLDGVRAGPDRTRRRRVIAPGTALGVEQIGECRVLETRVLLRRLRA